MEIRELHGREDVGYYTEGLSEVVAYLDRQRDVMNASQWFCFETETFAEAAMHLQRIGFTATQILDARPTWQSPFDCTCGGVGYGQHLSWCEAVADEVENDGPAGDYLADYWFTAGGPDEPPGI